MCRARILSMVEFQMSPSQSPGKTSTTQHSNGMQAEQGHEKDRLKRLLDMTNNLVSNLEPRELLRAIEEERGFDHIGRA